MPKRGSYIVTNEIIPKYDVGNRAIWERFETREYNEKLRNEVLQCLRDNYATFGKDDFYTSALGKLSRCRETARCLSPICPHCMSRFRRWNISQGLMAMEMYDDVYFVTWVPEPKFPPTFDFDPLKFVAKFQRRIDRRMKNVAADLVVWGYVELKVDPKLQCLVPHIHCFMANCTKKDIERLVRKRWNKEQSKPRLMKNRIINRPLEVSPVPRDERVEVFSYCCKLYHRGKRDYPTVKPKGPPNEKRRRMAKAVKKLFKKHRKFGFTELGYKKFHAASTRQAKGVSADAERINTLAGLSVHDMAVFRRLTRRGVDVTTLGWSNADYLENAAVRRNRGHLGFRDVVC